nr:MAG TPA: hypothetical protein [Caudoviricetes sp.]
MRFLSLVSPPSPATAGRQIFFKICIDNIIFYDIIKSSRGSDPRR